ncbi:MAG: patatin-like phospholipase family protein [Bacteroidales bacterium]|nr:patatin-like phospholipase family protein [Bacteroidales bacterium]
MVKSPVTLVLSGGGARGIAHIGVIDELEHRGYQIASVAGTSMGALVGGVYADGAIEAFREWMLSLDRLKVLSLVDFTLSKQGMIKGDKVFNRMKDFIPDTLIEDLAIPYAAVAVDLIHKREVVFKQGSLFDAIRASVSIPSVLTPVKTAEGLLVDGGVLNNIPINHAERIPGDLLVVVNVNASIPVKLPEISREEDEKLKHAYQKKMDEFQSYLQKILSYGQSGKQSQKHEEKMGYFNLIDKTITLMTDRIAQVSLNEHNPDVLVEVSHDACGTFDFYKAGEMIEMGRLAAAEALDGLESSRE